MCHIHAILLADHAPAPKMPPMEVNVQPLGRVIQVAPGTNLLEALRAAQVPLSYSCMAGRCGTCRCKVLEGDVMYAGPEQQRPLDGIDGHVLACQTVLTQPCTIQVAEPDEIVVHPARIVKATVTAIDDMTHDIKRLVLTPAKPVEYSPGQYAQLQFTPQHVRPYSMAGLCDDGRMEFHVRLVPDGRVTGYVAHDLKVGDAVRVRAGRSDRPTCAASMPGRCCAWPAAPGSRPSCRSCAARSRAACAIPSICTSGCVRRATCTGSTRCATCSGTIRR
jgi:ferredoxin